MVRVRDAAGGRDWAHRYLFFFLIRACHLTLSFLIAVCSRETDPKALKTKSCTKRFILNWTDFQKQNLQLFVFETVFTFSVFYLTCCVLLTQRTVLWGLHYFLYKFWLFFDLVTWFLSFFLVLVFFWKDQNMTETMLLSAVCHLLIDATPLFCSMIYNIFIYLKTNIYILLISETFNVIWRCPDITNRFWARWSRKSREGFHWKSTSFMFYFSSRFY